MRYPWPIKRVLSSSQTLSPPSANAGAFNSPRIGTPRFSRVFRKCVGSSLRTGLAIRSKIAPFGVMIIGSCIYTESTSPSMLSATSTTVPKDSRSCVNDLCSSISASVSGARQNPSSTNFPTFVGVRTNTLESGETISGVPQFELLTGVVLCNLA